MSARGQLRKSARIAKFEAGREEKNNRQDVINIVEGGDGGGEENSATTSSGIKGCVTDRRKTLKRKRLDQVTETSLHSPPNTHLGGEATENRNDLVEIGDRPSRDSMPESNILERVIDLLQLKDVRGLFASPVDCSEVEGYSNVIKQPMDFGTIRDKLRKNMYKTLEEFEFDVLLVSKNAMHFNAETTIFFRQARSINHLSKKIFEVLKANPELFDLEFPEPRRRPGRKSKSEAPSAPQTTRRRRARVNKRKGKNCTDDTYGSDVEFVDKRLSFLACKNPLDVNEQVLTLDNGPKQLVRTTQGGGRFDYMESLTKFCKGLGSTALEVARRKLSKLAPDFQFSPSESQELQIVSPTPCPDADSLATIHAKDPKGKTVISDDSAGNNWNRDKNNFLNNGLQLPNWTSSLSARGSAGTDNDLRAGGFMNDARGSYRNGEVMSLFQAQGDMPTITNAAIISGSSSTGLLATGSSSNNIGGSDPKSSSLVYPSTYLRPSRMASINPIPTNKMLQYNGLSCMQTASSHSSTSSSWSASDGGHPNTTAENIEEQLSSISGSFIKLMSLAVDPWSKESMEVFESPKTHPQAQQEPSSGTGIGYFTRLLTQPIDPLSQDGREIYGCHLEPINPLSLKCLINDTRQQPVITAPHPATAPYIQIQDTQASVLSPNSWAASFPLGQEPYLVHSLGAPNGGYWPNNASMPGRAALERRQLMPPPRRGNCGVRAYWKRV